MVPAARADISNPAATSRRVAAPIAFAIGPTLSSLASKASVARALAAFSSEKSRQSPSRIASSSEIWRHGIGASSSVRAASPPSSAIAIWKSASAPAAFTATNPRCSRCGGHCPRSAAATQPRIAQSRNRPPLQRLFTGRSTKAYIKSLSSTRLDAVLVGLYVIASHLQFTFCRDHVVGPGRCITGQRWDAAANPPHRAAMGCGTTASRGWRGGSFNSPPLGQRFGGRPRYCFATGSDRPRRSISQRRLQKPDALLGLIGPTVDQPACRDVAIGFGCGLHILELAEQHLVIVGKRADHRFGPDVRVVVIADRGAATDVADGAQRLRAIFAYPLGDQVGGRENLRRLFVEQKMQFAKLRSLDVPVIIFCLEVEGKTVGEQRVERVGYGGSIIGVLGHGSILSLVL